MEYINVRRIFIYIVHSIEEGTQWAVFEPNERSQGMSPTRKLAGVS